MLKLINGTKKPLPTKAEVFEELIWIVCGVRVKLKPAPVGGGHDDRAGGHESGRAC